MKTTFRKTTAALLAILSVLFTFCITSFASEKQGGAELWTGSEVTHYESIEEAWNTAMKTPEPVRVKLLQDWVADENGSLGTGEYFYNGAIGVYNRFQELTLDLNGYKIDRGLTEARRDGFVFFIVNSKNIIITDSSVAATGVITGGNNKGDGGAFKIEGAKLTVSDVTIKGNKSSYKGGAFWLQLIEGNSACRLSEVTLDNCRITENTAKTGGAIYVETSNRIRVFDSVITNNSAVADGGIHTEVFGFVVANITLGGKVIIADNYAEKGGKGLMLDENLFTKVVIEFSKERPLSDESEIVILSKTGDKTLRITENSDDNHIGCFRYENGKYEIVAKGSGSEKYLDIKKN